MVGVLGIEPRSDAPHAPILAVILHPVVGRILPRYEANSLCPPSMYRGGKGGVVLICARLQYQQNANCQKKTKEPPNSC